MADESTTLHRLRHSRLTHLGDQNVSAPLERHASAMKISEPRGADRYFRTSQARFVCTACGFACNAAKNIAAGHPTHLPVPLHSRGGFRDAGPVNREPQLLLQSA